MRAFVLIMAFLGGCWGAPVPQSEPCRVFVSCVRALDAASGEATNLDRFAEAGECWGNPNIGELCTTACTRGLERFQRAADLPEACSP